jgi:Ca2+-binding EF-hand superfamily protein
MGKSFSIIDSDRSGYLTKEEFSKALRNYRISDDPKEI